MVEGQSGAEVEGGSSGAPPLAIDDAIALVDSLILRVQAPHSPPESAHKKEAFPPKLSPESAEVNTVQQQQQEAPKGLVLDRPGKKPLKLPGVPAEKPSKPSDVANPSGEKGSEHQENFEKAHFQVGLVHSVGDHPISEKLYVCKVEVATGQFKQVVAGLRNFVPISDLEGKKVALILNLKPAKLAGQLSEAMILAAAAHTDGVETALQVLEPPSHASVGDRIYLQGSTPSAPAKQLSSKIWEKVVPLLKVEGGVAAFNKTPLVTSSGEVRVPDLPDGAGIH